MLRVWTILTIAAVATVLGLTAWNFWHHHH